MPRLDTATGSRSIRVMLTAWRVPADVVSMTAAIGRTVTTSVTGARNSETVMSSGTPDVSSTRWVLGWKPLSSTVTSWRPSVRFGIAKRPCPSEAVTRSSPLAGCRCSTVAPGTAAPCSSSTTPRTALVTCAAAVAAVAAARAAVNASAISHLTRFDVLAERSKDKF
jgi:hypothetical protein